MRKIKITTMALGLVVCSIATSQASLTLGFSSDTGSTVSFNGVGGFSFLNGSPGNGFQITTSSLTGPGSGVNDLGTISSTFGIGSVSIIPLGGGATYQSASVTGSGTLTISDGSKDLTATVVWDLIATQPGSGNINVNGNLNVTGIAYTGTQTALLALLNAGSATDQVSFTLPSSDTLTYLKANSVSTAYSGSITAVPEASTMIFGGLLLLPFGLITSQSLRKMRSVA